MVVKRCVIEIDVRFRHDSSIVFWIFFSLSLKFFFELATEASNNTNNNINYDEEDTRCESDFDGSDESENEQKPLASSQPQETPTTISQAEQHEPSTPANPHEKSTKTTVEYEYPTPQSQPPLRTETIADRVERLEKNMAELMRHVKLNTADKTTELF